MRLSSLSDKTERLALEPREILTALCESFSTEEQVRIQRHCRSTIGASAISAENAADQDSGVLAGLYVGPSTEISEEGQNRFDLLEVCV